MAVIAKSTKQRREETLGDYGFPGVFDEPQEVEFGEAPAARVMPRDPIEPAVRFIRRGFRPGYTYRVYNG